MKKLIALCMLLFCSIIVFAQSDPILGKWQNPSGEGRIEIFKKGEKYYGKLYWLKNPNDASGNLKKDVKNPDQNLQSRTLQGAEILSGFVKNGNSYEDGKIYDPKNGKTYSCKMSLNGHDKLNIRGYLGISLLGRTDVFTRVK